MIVDAGYAALPIALVVSGYAVLASFLGALQRVPALVLSGRYGFYTIPALLAVSTAALVYAFVNHDFSVRYVAENSNMAMPAAYTWVAFYAGNAGSLLFIAIVFSLLAVGAVASMTRRLPYTSPYATSLMAVFLTFLLGVIVFLANPLERLDFVPMDGRGINPSARPFRDVHTPACPDDRTRVGSRAVQHSHGRDAGAARRARRVGGPGQGVGHGVVAAADHWAAAGLLVGLHHPGMGWLLGMGPGGELRP